MVENYAGIRRGAEWVLRAIQREKERLANADAIGYGMLPPAHGEAGDFGHNHYVNSFAVLGLNMAARAADAMEQKGEAQRFRQQAKELQDVLHEVIRTDFLRFNDFAGTFPCAP